MRGSAASSPGAVLLIAVIGALTFAGTSAGDSSTSADAAAAAQGRLVFTARFDESGGPYGAGATPFVVVRDSAGRVVAQRSASSGRAAISLPRGRYAVSAYWRPCEGRCDAEDLPLDRCGKRVSIRTAARGASESVTFAAVFKGGDPCSARVSSDWPPQAVIRTPATSLKAARGPYCRPAPKTCVLPASQPSTQRRLPIRAGTLVTIDLKVPTRRLELTGICGSGPLSHSKAGRRWSFKVPRETAGSIRTCHDIKLTITYAGPGVRHGVKAVFGFDLRLAG
jgi:hypothetical protein